MAAYAAFLRGINVGGKKLISMARLQASFESLGFQNVKTVLASGNVLFETAKVGRAGLTASIEAALKHAFGHDIAVQLRGMVELRRLAASKPFDKIRVTPKTALYVTFLARRPSMRSSGRGVRTHKGCTILRVSAREVFSVVTLAPGVRSTDFMNVLEREFGRDITTRNWNTIARILKSAGAG